MPKPFMTANSSTGLSRKTKKPSLFPSGNYAYVTARVKAKRSLLLTKDTYSRLLVMDVPEITRFIGESQYKREVNELGLKYSKLELIELALNRNLANVLHQILGFCKGDLLLMVSAYLQRWDLWNIKTILRGKYYKAAPDEILKTLIPAGKYPEKYWKEIIYNTDSVESSIEAMKGNEYYPILVKIKDKFGLDLYKCENWLEIEYYNYLLRSISPATKANELFLDFIKEEIDLINLKTLFMTKYDDLEPENIKELVIPGGKIFKNNLDALVKTEDFNQFINELVKIPSYEPMREYVVKKIEESGTLIHVIRALEKGYITKADRFSRLYPLSVLPVLNYMIRKRLEIDNLRIIALGKSSGLTEEQINEMLVV